MEKALTSLMSWVDERLPLTRTWNTHMGEYYAPKNFNLWYFFGVFSLLVLVNQLLTGIWLTMNYTPSAEEAFASVETSCAMSITAGCCVTCTRQVPQRFSLSHTSICIER